MEEEFEDLEIEQSEQPMTTAQMTACMLEYIVALMCATIFILVPLYMKDGYFGIGTGKYEMYRNILFLVAPLLALFSVIYLFAIRKQITWKWIKENLSVIDKAVLVYLVCVITSFILSEFKAEAIWGYKGWFMGLISQISFVLLYFFVSRFGRYGKVLLPLLCLVSVIVFVLGILNRFLIDPLGVYAEIDERYKLEFLSTLGQSSWYSSFMCTVLPMGIYYFWSAQSGWKSVLGGIYCIIGFSTLITQNSDSAYIALLGILVVLFCFSAKNSEKMEKFYWVTFLFLVATRLMNLGAQILNNQMIEKLETLSYFLIMSPILWGLLVFNVLLLLGHTIVQRRGCYSIRVAMVVRNIVLGLLVVAVVFSVLCLWLSGTGKLPQSIAGITNQIPYLQWNDMWGNRRGFSWRITWQMFMEMSPLDKIFGVGPECYPFYAYDRYQAVLDTMFDGLVLSNAHNEWYNAVINYGIVGGASYLGIFVVAIRHFAKKVADEPMMVGVVLVLIAYMGHNLFCYQQVLCTPFVFIIIGIAEWTIQQAKRTKRGM